MLKALNVYEEKGDSAHLIDRMTLNAYDFECLWGEGWLYIPNRWDDFEHLWGAWVTLHAYLKWVALNAYGGKGDFAHLIWGCGFEHLSEKAALNA